MQGNYNFSKEILEHPTVKRAAVYNSHALLVRTCKSEGKDNQGEPLFEVNHSGPLSVHGMDVEAIKQYQIEFRAVAQKKYEEGQRSEESAAYRKAEMRLLAVASSATMAWTGYKSTTSFSSNSLAEISSKANDSCERPYTISWIASEAKRILIQSCKENRVDDYLNEAQIIVGSSLIASLALAVITGVYYKSASRKKSEAKASFIEAALANGNDIACENEVQLQIASRNPQPQ